MLAFYCARRRSFRISRYTQFCLPFLVRRRSLLFDKYLKLPSKHEILNHFWFNADPPSATLGQFQASIDSMSRVSWVRKSNVKPYFSKDGHGSGASDPTSHSVNTAAQSKKTVPSQTRQVETMMF